MRRKIIYLIVLTALLGLIAACREAPALSLIHI